MKFGYFTLSDNHYDNNPRSPNQFVADIIDEALYAETLGMHSAWIGEHHFSTLGVLSCPDLALAYIAARTQRIRLAPAVTVLPLHHPIRVAEQWASLDLLSGGRVDFAAGRGYDRREYAPAWRVVRRQPVDLRGRHGDRAAPVVGRSTDLASRPALRFDDVAITPQPVQQPIPAYVASFSKPSIELAARLGCGLIVAPFAAAMTFGGLQQVRELYHETCAKHGTTPGRLMCSYFTHFADDDAQQQAARARQIRYYKECVIPAFPGDPATAPPSYRYFIAMVERLRNVRPEDLTENSVLLGSPAHITDDAEAGGSGRRRRGDPVFQRRAEAARTGQGRDGAVHGAGGAALPMSMHDRLALYSRNNLKLGLFGANCSSGRAVTKVPERWSGNWDDCLRLARMADEAGIEFMLPVGRWKGYGGDTDYQGETLETVTWAAGLLGATQRLTVFGTVHAPLIHPLIAAKQFVTADHHRPGPLWAQHRLRLERGRVRHVRRHDARTRRALRVRAGVVRCDPPRLVGCRGLRSSTAGSSGCARHARSRSRTAAAGRS